MTSEQSQSRLLRIDLTGRKIRRWTVKQRAKLVGMIRTSLRRLSEVPVDSETSETAGEKAKKFSSKALRNVEARLDGQAIENQLKQAQIEMVYEERESSKVVRQRTQAETRKLRAEAESQELQNRQTKLELELMHKLTSLTGSNPPIEFVGEPGDEIALCPPDVRRQLEARLLGAEATHLEGETNSECSDSDD